jgi:hypothetical protein
LASAWGIAVCAALLASVSAKSPRLSRSLFDGKMFDHRTGCRKEDALVAILPADEIGRCAILSMHFKDHTFADFISDVPALHDQRITCNGSHGSSNSIAI